jgi:hypothetical protein
MTMMNLRIGGLGLAGVIGAAVVLAAMPAGPASAATAWRSTELRVPAHASANPQAHLFAAGCAGTAYCVLGGNYTTTAGASEGMLAARAKGTWARAIRLALPSNAARKPAGTVDSVACTGAGSCVAVGSYDYGNGTDAQAFIATEARGRWARATTVRLPAGSARTVDSGLGAVSCPKPGSCVAAGGYAVKGGGDSMMITTESKGKWGRARALGSPPGAGPAGLSGLACPRVGYCSAVGDYEAGSVFNLRPLAVTESKGKWGRASAVGLPAGAVKTDDQAVFTGVACTGSGSCVAVGNYFNGGGLGLVMGATESKGRWHAAAQISLPASTGVQDGDSAELFGVACGSAGSCTAVGGYTSTAVSAGGTPQAMAVTESKGRWGRAAPVSAPSNAGGGSGQVSFLYAVACPGRSCVAAGIYADKSGKRQPMAATGP